MPWDEDHAERPVSAVVTYPGTYRFRDIRWHASEPGRLLTRHGPLYLT
jgi:hypothetical protein